MIAKLIRTLSPAILFILVVASSLAVLAVTSGKAPPPMEALAGTWEIKGTGKAYQPDGTSRSIKIAETWIVVVSDEPGLNVHWMSSGGEGDYKASYRGGVLFIQSLTGDVVLSSLLEVKGAGKALKMAGTFVYNDYAAQENFAAAGKLSGKQVTNDE